MWQRRENNADCDLYELWYLVQQRAADVCSRRRICSSEAGVVSSSDCGGARSLQPQRQKSRVGDITHGLHAGRVGYVAGLLQEREQELHCGALLKERAGSGCSARGRGADRVLGLGCVFERLLFLLGFGIYK
jgi:hypothetical protein